MAAQRVVTNLVGKSIHLLTDYEARQEARKQGMKEEEIKDIGVRNWIPALMEKRYDSIRQSTGEIVAVHVNKECNLEYTVCFDGEIMKMSESFFRLGIYPSHIPIDKV